MQDLLSNLRAIGKELQALMAQKLEILQPEIQYQIKTPAMAGDGQRIEHLLDQLLDCLLMGIGQQEFVQLLTKLKTIDPEAEAFYLKELEDMQSDELPES